ncbi:MAG TPA: Ohr family peroxiredoxin [Caulobacterales bacterium]|nr:Ohr family peroxiredoxin [Caulobacterales bacterium]
MNVPSSILATTSATSHGGRAGGKVVLDEGGLWFHMEHDKGLGGGGQGCTPEDFFALGYSACFNSALLFVASQQKIDAAKATVTAEVGIGRTAENKFALTVTLKVHMPGVDAAKAKELAEAAHQVCPYSSATRGNVPVTLEVI